MLQIKETLFFEHSSKNWKCLSVYPTAQLLSTLILTRNVSWAANQHILEGSCDTEDLNNDAENSAMPQENIFKKNSYSKL